MIIGIIKFMFNTLSESMGHPVTLLKLIGKHPDIAPHLVEPDKNIAPDSIVRWEDWGGSLHRQRGTLPGWRWSPGAYESFTIRRSELEQFGLCEVVENWECEIQAIVGLSASKSKLDEFASLDDFAESNCHGLVDSLSEESFSKNLAHQEIRILHREYTSDHFSRHLWDGRLFLRNSGGSHHFAAARYIAAKIGKLVWLNGTLRIYKINPLSVRGLRNDFDMFVMSDDPAITNGFHDAMAAFRATYFWLPMPIHYDNTRVILLPKQEWRSAKIAASLRSAGLFDLGQHLSELIVRQAAHC